MGSPVSISVTPLLVADLHVEGERMPVYVHLIDHPDGRVLIDTGMTEHHPLLDDTLATIRLNRLLPRVSGSGGRIRTYDQAVNSPPPRNGDQRQNQSPSQSPAR